MYCVSGLTIGDKETTVNNTYSLLYCSLNLNRTNRKLKITQESIKYVKKWKARCKKISLEKSNALDGAGAVIRENSL